MCLLLLIFSVISEQRQDLLIFLFCLICIIMIGKRCVKLHAFPLKGLSAKVSRSPTIMRGEIKGQLTFPQVCYKAELRCKKYVKF